MRRPLPTLWLGCLLLLPRAALAGGPAPKEVQFNRDIRPILSDRCFNCHGPDHRRKAGLRLDTGKGAAAELDSGSGRAVVPGDPGRSQLLARLMSADPARRMPPPATGKALTPAQVELLRRWIEQGAKYQGHWAFLPPARHEPPKVSQPSWVRNPIDRFILARLDREGLRSAPEAPRTTLLRRVTLDLTGLPPTPRALEAFLADRAPDAYEKVVDRLLASPAYGERMAMHWLDLARYADTNGYNNDEERTMWPWRDWVIDAFNDNVPYDRFLVEQLAGDLLPNATLTQKLATGFNRNHVITTEGGVIPEEYRVEYVADRVHTTATVFLGLSMQCARCHDHKFDPLPQQDYYRFFAFFNNVEDQTVGYNSGAAARPYLRIPTRQHRAELDMLDRRLAEGERLLRGREAGAGAAVAEWEKGLTPADVARASLAGLSLHLPLDDAKGNTVRDAVAGSAPGTVKGQARWGVGKVGGALEFDGKTHVELEGAGALERSDAFTIAAWIYPTSGEGMAVLSKMDESNAYRGYDLLLEGGKVVVHLIHHWGDNALKVMAKQPLTLNAWHHVAVTHDGSGKAAGLAVYVDGKRQALDVHTDQLSGSIRTEQPLRVGLRTKSLPFKGRIDDVQFHRLALAPQDVARLADGRAVVGLAEVLKVPPEKRTADQRQQVRRVYLETVDAEYRRLNAERRELTGRRAAVEKSVPFTMVMAEQSTPRKTHLLKRGQYDAPGAEVSPEVPKSLPPLPKDAPRNRLGLARWLVEPNHPLTARVSVNRWWELLFGTGIVETPEDFGAQGAWPSHPELLDWLATELVRTRWDMKGMLKLIVTSATYRQSSNVTRELLERDPRNRLLARGPRVRLPAEVVRDNALAVSGLLVAKLGGPSVKPYQPAGLWEDVSVERRAIYKPDLGEGLYRRSMYTYWKRTCPPPGMTTLDAPDRETCTVRRARTNTPMQALLLLNDPTYLEASRKLAERLLTEGGPSFGSRLAHGFKLALARSPGEAEAKILEALYRRALERFRKDDKAAEGLLAVGHSSRNPALDTAELAAWTTVASTILNLDEALTKE